MNDIQHASTRGDGLEIAPMIATGYGLERGEYASEADYWAVFAHFEGIGANWLCQFITIEQAAEFAAMMRAKFPPLRKYGISHCYST